MAAQTLNKNAQRPVYGIVTDAEVWQFGKLEEHCFTRNLTRATIDDLPKIFGGVYQIMQLAAHGASL